MPTVSEFKGIQIKMYFNDHNPPHFHAVYGQNDIIVRISPIKVLGGHVPARIKGFVERWAKIHTRELMEAWNRVRSAQMPKKIPPL
jgi:hypothetical protein